jgi:hypothetical protein
MTVCLVTIADGRNEYHVRSRVSLQEMLPGVAHVVKVNDWDHKLGFGGAIREGWSTALELEWTHCFHAELDFVYLRPVPLDAMVAALQAHPYLVQMALLRGPVNDAEYRAGGVIEQHPDDYWPVDWGQHTWREHRRYVTTNPAVWPRWVIERGWPEVAQSEGHFGIDLFTEDPARRAAYWGDTVTVQHIGHERTGHGY